MDQLLVAVITGCFAILIGVTPLGGLLEDFVDSIERFRSEINGVPPRRPIRLISQDGRKRFKGQIWFAVAGVGLIVIAIADSLFR
jgi:hypothetical protein